MFLTLFDHVASNFLRKLLESALNMASIFGSFDFEYFNCVEPLILAVVTELAFFGDQLTSVHSVILICFDFIKHFVLSQPYDDLALACVM